MLRKPILALTSDRTKTAEKNNVCGAPEDWFDSEYFRRYSIYSASFDFLWIGVRIPYATKYG